MAVHTIGCGQSQGLASTIRVARDDAQVPKGCAAATASTRQ